MKVYLVRTIDLENVAYSDRFYKNRKDALESVKSIKKSDSYTDIVIKIITGYQDFEEFVERFETENVYQAFDDNSIVAPVIIYKR